MNIKKNILDDVKSFDNSLLEWYKLYGRHHLPWRIKPTPYNVLVSEMMLQQTQVERVCDSYYPRFINTYPDIYSLAKSNWDEMYPYWRGLGYYARGERLLETAKIVVKEHHGHIPKDYRTLKSLPGIGSYTADAIRAFAYNHKVIALDTNIIQLLKAFCPDKLFYETAHILLNGVLEGRDFNNAMMDLASYVRTGRALEGCIKDYFDDDMLIKLMPNRTHTSSETRLKFIDVGVACIRNGDKYYIQKRQRDKRYAGEWEFPGGKKEPGESLRDCVKREVMEECGVEVSVRPHFHEEIILYDTGKIRLRFHRCLIQKGTLTPLEGQDGAWMTLQDIVNIGMIDTNKGAINKLLEMKH